MQSNDQAGARRFGNNIDWHCSIGEKEYHETHGMMNKHTPPEFTLLDALGIIRELRKDLTRHEQLLG